MAELMQHRKGNVVLQNVIWLGAGEMVSRLLMFLFLIVVARVLGAYGYGIFAFGLSITSLVLVIAQFGIPAIFVRDAAQDQKWERAFPAFLTLGLFSGLGALVALAGTAFFLSGEISLRLLFLFFGGYVAAMTVLEFFFGFFRAREEMRYEAALKIFQAAMIVSLGALALWLAPTPQYLALGYAGGAVISLMLMATIFLCRVFSLRIQIDLSLWKKALSDAWPLGMMGVFVVVYNSIDSIMLGAFGQITEVGWYNAAYRVVGAALIPAVFLGNSFLPALSKRIWSSVDSLQALWERQIEAALMIGVPASIGGAMVAPGLIRALYTPEFEPAIFALQILIWTVALTFLVSACSYMLFVAEAQKKSFWIAGVGAIGNVFLNIWLIPAWSLYGAAVATLVTYIVMFFLCGEAVRRYTPAHIFTASLGKILCVVVGASGIMAAVLKLVPSSPLPFLVLLGVCTYGFAYAAIRKMIFGTSFPYTP